MMEYQPISHPYNSSCGYCHDHEESYIFGEDSISCSPVFESCSVRFEQEPFRYNYLLNLMTAPDMNAYLSVASFNDDIYALPIHLQRLISEAREEILLSKNKNYTEKSAQLRLERVRNLVWQRSAGDFSILMNTLVELVSDEDELEDLLRI
ncbi:uncharacterized protein EV154DRAFT_507650 [Mucor mucedo]|uniref:Uncharacterized protein n=1 Tax=Mucor saturninus TaxID=64648 RepID=A0A8H7R8V3_9FUNG|nr:uncharacterized protein EV154DRAFT_507650 [Mucor mucedo]KAG2206494.1 hypothetical protein INT47_008511 [Mucor saturninus]KAI7891513.1 hypothetical protein EV154DRAFT_507650 [Mucor mucedo]